MVPSPEAEPPGRRPPELRVSDQERTAAVQWLQTAFAEGRLTDEEFETRARAALTARTQGELAPLLADLPVAPAAPPLPSPPARAWRVGHLVLAIMGSTRRRGRWRVPPWCTSVAIMGSCRLDLRAARCDAPVTVITAVAIMGSIDVLVPPGVRVEMRGLSLMGDWSNTVGEADLPSGAPEVHVRGIALMGSVRVRTRAPTHER